MPRMPPGGNPYDSQQQQGYTIVEDPRAGYFSTATLPSNAALRKPSGPGYVFATYSFIFHIACAFSNITALQMCFFTLCEFYKCASSYNLLEKMIYYNICICDLCTLRELHECASSNFVP